jgi:hypothetical protein
MSAIQIPSDDELTMILSKFLKTVPQSDYQPVEEPLGYVMTKEKLDEVVRTEPSFRHLIHVGALRCHG